MSWKTLARIYAGAVKFGWPAPFLVIPRNHMDAQTLNEPLPTLCAGGTHIGLAEPFLLNRHGDNGAVRAHDIDHPMPTADCRGAGYLCEPFIANLAHAGADQGRCRTIEEPLQTLNAGGLSHALVEPFIMSGQSGGSPRPLDEPMPGMTGRLGSAHIAPFYGSGSGETGSSTDKPLPTVTTKARFGLVMPVTHGKGRNRVRDLEEPLPTVTGAHRRKLACIVAAWGERPCQAPRVHSVDEPTPTICAAGRI